MHLALAAAAAVLSCGLVAPAVAAAPADPVPSTTELPSVVAPALATSPTGETVLVAGVPDGAGQIGQIIVSTRPAADAAWTPPVALSSSSKALLEPAVAISSAGHVAVAWGSRFGGPIRVRVRGADGVWAAEQNLRGVTAYGTPQVVVNAAGDAAVAADRMSGEPEIALLRQGGDWQLTEAPSSFSTPAIGLADDGTLYAVANEVNRGGFGVAVLSRRTPAGHWSRPRQVPSPNKMVQDSSLVVSPTGRVTVALGYSTRRWRSTADTELYWSTAWAVQELGRWKGGFSRVWRRVGARSLSLTQSTTGDVALTWQEWRGRTTGDRPTRIALLTKRLREPVATTLAVQPASIYHGFFETDTAVTGSDVLVVWRGAPAHQRLLGPTYAAEVTASGATTSLLTGETPPLAALSTDTAPAVTSLPDGFVLAWTHGLVIGSSDDGRFVRDGSTALADLPR